MSFRVNTNVSAMNALRNVSATGDALSQSITRLSTGLRINSAADDPAGLIISQSFRAQITGIDQAMKNSQDAINYVKTAEGALDEVNKLLNDARGLAVAAGNSGTLSSSQIQANQSQLASIVASITRIAQTTQYGTKRLLDGSSGVNATVTDGTHISQLSIGGTFGGQAVAANSSVVMTVNAASTQASVASRDFGADDSTALGAGNAGSFTINGVTFVGEATDNAATVRDKINAASAQTGVVATTNNTGVITLTSTKYGSGADINLSDATGAIRNGGAGYTSVSGTDGNATVTVNGVSALFTASKNGNDGLTFTDADGNSLTVTAAGNNTGVVNQTIGQVVVGAASFQIGANAGQTTTFSLGNFQASNLGAGAVSGLTMSNLDLTTSSGASDALKVIDKAIDQISSSRGDMGNFQRNVMESNIRALGTARENMSATYSSITDVDVAQEMTNYTKLQILQQAGMAVLSQANSAPQAVLSLLR